MKKFLLITFMVTELSFSQNFFPILGGQRAGTSVFTFLKIGVSARAVGMGEAVVALEQDAASAYYNPGTIAQFKQTEISAARIQWPADINYDYFSISGNVSGRHFGGVSFGILHMAPMQETTEYLSQGTGNYFTFQDRFFALSYGARMTDRFSFGLTLKQVQEDLAGSSMNAIMMDVGTFYWTGYKSLRFSASLSHFGAQSRPKGTFEKSILDQGTGNEETIRAKFESFSPPTVFRVGAAMDVWNAMSQAMLLSLQLNHPVDNAENISAGLEYQFANLIFIRSGYKINNEEENVSFGVGLLIPLGTHQLRLDYAYSNFDHLSDPQRISLGVSF